jgi:hypothetical protein
MIITRTIDLNRAKKQIFRMELAARNLYITEEEPCLIHSWAGELDQAFRILAVAALIRGAGRIFEKSYSKLKGFPS